MVYLSVNIYFKCLFSNLYFQPRHKVTRGLHALIKSYVNFFRFDFKGLVENAHMRICAYTDIRIYGYTDIKLTCHLRHRNFKGDHGI